MDFAFPPGTSKYDLMIGTIYSCRKTTTIVSAPGTNSIKDFFFHLTTPFTSSSKMKNCISNLTLSIALFLNCYNHKTMSKNFCDCLIQNDWDCVKTEVNKYLNTLNKNNSEDSISADFKQWLLKNECVTDVNILPGLVETNPPIKQFALKITSPKGIIEKTLGIQISKKILQVHIY